MATEDAAPWPLRLRLVLDEAGVAGRFFVGDATGEEEREAEVFCCLRERRVAGAVGGTDDCDDVALRVVFFRPPALVVLFWLSCSCR